MKRLPFAFALIVALSLATLTRAAEPRVLIVSIDGLRPDCALRADAPTIRSLMKDGAFSFWATTTPAAITLPSHTSMLTGVTIERHGIRGNDEKAADNEKLNATTIFEIAQKAGISTGMAAGKIKFKLFMPAIDHGWVTPKSSTNTTDAADHAVSIIKEFKPRLMFVHFPSVDGAGHGKGWGTHEQIAAIEDADKNLGRVFDAMREAGVFDDTTIILSADHGGSGKGHGKDDDRSKFIPWLTRGPGIRKNFDLTQIKELKIQTYDTMATACYVLGLTPPEGIDGKPIKEILEATELMSSTTKPATQPATQPAARRPDLRGHDNEGQTVLYADGYVDWSKVDGATTQPVKAPSSGGDRYTVGAKSGSGFQFNDTISADFAIMADICSGVPTTQPATQPSAATGGEVVVYTASHLDLQTQPVIGSGVENIYTSRPTSQPATNNSRRGSINNDTDPRNIIYADGKEGPGPTTQPWVGSGSDTRPSTQPAATTMHFDGNDPILLPTDD